MEEGIKIGDAVKSYDFPGYDLYFVKGVVEDIVVLDGCTRYKIKVEASYDEDGEYAGPEYVYPPVNGTKNLFGGVTNGVVKI